MKKAVSILALFILTSCGTSHIASNKSPDFNEKISRLFIMIKGADSSHQFFQRFTGDFNIALEEKGIESETYYFDHLSLDPESDINGKISSYQPNLTMTINQTESRKLVTSHGFISSTTDTGGSFEVQIFQPNSKKPVWKAYLQADSEFGLEIAAKKACQKLITQLIEDKLL